MQTQEYQISTTRLNVQEAVEALKKGIEKRGLTIFSHINHGKEAKKVNLELEDVQLLVFGDPKVGTFLMQENPLIGIELPLKILVWSAGDKTQMAFPNVELWQKRFNITEHAPILQNMSKLFDNLIQETSKSRV